MLKIVKIPNPVLSTPAKPVPVIDQKIIKLIQEMEKTLVFQSNPQGVGLAAPQVGYSLTLFIIKPIKRAKTEAFINPKLIESTSEVKTEKNPPLEGCLSIPNVWSPVTRQRRILVEYQDIYKTTRKEWFTGFKATIIQHEIDHLRGVLFTQRALEQGTDLYEEQQGELKRLHGLK